MLAPSQVCRSAPTAARFCHCAHNAATSASQTQIGVWVRAARKFCKHVFRSAPPAPCSLCAASPTSSSVFGLQLEASFPALASTHALRRSVFSGMTPLSAEGLGLTARAA